MGRHVRRAGSTAISKLPSGARDRLRRKVISPIRGRLDQAAIRRTSVLLSEPGRRQLTPAVRGGLGGIEAQVLSGVAVKVAGRRSMSAQLAAALEPVRRAWLTRLATDAQRGELSAEDRADVERAAAALLGR